jgi:hypothetical protein
MPHDKMESNFTIPIHFLRMLQILKSFLENIGEGKLVLKKKRKSNSSLSCH